MSWRAAALGNSSSKAVRSSGDISFRMATTCSCAMPRSNFPLLRLEVEDTRKRRPRASEEGARKMMTRSSSRPCSR